jgi:hypothetical protein
MNLTNPLRLLLSAVRVARSPQTGRHHHQPNIRQTTAAAEVTVAEPPAGWSAAEVEAERRREEDTTYLTVEQIRRVMHQLPNDKFPAVPAAPSGPRPRGEAEVVRPREVPDNSAPDRWTP